MSNFYVCVTYYSLPSFPKACRIVKNHDVVPRDVLLCNRTNNHHMRGGMQYDPNIENAEYAVCEPPVRRSLERRAKKHDELYLIFRTRHFKLDGSTKYLVTGFYEVEKEFDKTLREAPIIHAQDMHFVSLSDCIDITGKIKEANAFRCCFTSDNTLWEKELATWSTQLSDSKDQTQKYIEEIKSLKKVFYENEIQGKAYHICSSCEHRNYRTQNCPLAWRLQCRSVNPNPANSMKNLDEYFKSILPDERKPIT